MFETDDLAERRAKLAARRARLSATQKAERGELLKRAVAEDTALRVIPRRPQGEVAPLSFAQQRLWFLDQFEPGRATYNIPIVCRLVGQLGVGALKRGLNETIRRHESLRTTFATAAEGPIQVIAPTLTLPLPIIDLKRLSEKRREAEARRLAMAEVQAPFNLEKGPLLRVTLIRFGCEDHELSGTIHHIIADAWSLELLIQEVGTLYRAFCAGEKASLEELPIQYADYAHWQRQWLQGAVLESHISYWRAQLEDAPPVIKLPTDRPRPAIMSSRGSTERGVVPEHLTEGIRDLSKAEGVSLFATLLTSFQILLSWYSGERDVVVGTPVAGRRWVETESLIGFFVNTLVIRTRLPAHRDIRHILRHVRQVVVEAQTHQELPFERLVEELRLERSLSHAPLFQVMLAFQSAGKSPVEVEGLTLNWLEFDTGLEKFDLTLLIAEDKRGLSLSLSYSRDLFDASTIKRMLKHWLRVLEAMVLDLEQTPWDVPLLGKIERHQLQAEWNEVAKIGQPDECLHELFEAQAASRPESIAVSFGEESISYGMLNRKANQMANYLGDVGVAQETLVGICMRRSVEMIVGILGVLKSGGAYVALDPGYPSYRLRLLLEDSKTRVLMVLSDVPDGLAVGEIKVVDIAHLRSEEGPGKSLSTQQLRRTTTPQNLAYLIYTSGTTGKPKGVAIAHASSAALVRWAGTVYSNEELREVLASTSICFDLSIFEIFMPLAKGGQIVLVDDALDLAVMPEAARVTLINTVPAVMDAIVEGELPGSVRVVNLAGEPLSRHLATRIYSRTYGVKVCNLYGPSEDTTYSTYGWVRADAAQEPSIGRSVAGTWAYLVDRGLRLVPQGAWGELLLGGLGVARCYFGVPALTASRFVPDPLSGLPGERLYRTGDLARYRQDGELEFLGRMDRQVKIRGHRIELGEVEVALRRCPSVKNAAVVDREDGRGGRRLVAYFVAKRVPAPSIGELSGWLKERLPDYMLPSSWVSVEEIPLNSNGKVDRSALPEPGRMRGEVKEGPSRPQTLIEEIVAGIWGEVLGLSEVGRADDFFDLGGHSLLATQVISRLRESLQIELPVRSMFETSTLVSLSRRIEETMQAGRGLLLPPLRRTPRGETLPLAYMQKGLWYLDQLTPGSNVYNLPASVQLSIDVEVPVLEKCLSEVVRRHETLRTTFIAEKGQPRQVIGRPEPVRLTLVDLSSLTEKDRASEVERLVRDNALRPFDLTAGPLVRFSLLRLDQKQHLMSVNMHHIISDGWSMSVLMEELRSLYEAFSLGLSSPLAELEIQYADYATWQIEWLQGDLFKTGLEYWKQELGGAPAILDLSTDRPYTTVRKLPGAYCEVRLPKDLTSSLLELTNKEGATLFMVLMAGYQALLGQYTKQSDILVGTPIAGRRRLELERLIGLFVNMLVLRADLETDPIFRSFLGQVKETALEAYTYQDLPFDKLVEELQPVRAIGRNPFFQTILAYQNDQTPKMDMAGVTLLSGSPGGAPTKFDLEVYLWNSPNGLRGSFVFSPELFDRTTIARLTKRFQRLLEQVASNPDLRLSEYFLVERAEVQQVVREWNDTGIDFPSERNVADLFESQVKAMPDAIAVDCDETQLCYQDLSHRANVLAHDLMEQGIGPEVPVGVLLNRSVEMILALLGIAKAGGIYVPLNITDPIERIRHILEDAGVTIILTSNQIAKELPQHDLTVICVDSSQYHGGAFERQYSRQNIRADNLLYIMHTSGSTGLPKGVCVSHRNVVRLIKGANYADLTGPHTILQFAPVSFDASTFEIWACLLNGGRLAVFPPELPSLGELKEFIIKSKVTTAWLTAGLFHQMVDGDIHELTSLQQMLAGGDVLSGAHVNRFLMTLGGCRLINGYGPTETTTFACCHCIERMPSRGVVPIGRPISNTSVHVLGGNLHPATIGERGEVFIGGAGLARGYLGQPALTAERFLPDSMAGLPGGRLYRTGDVARYLEDGRVEFLGRVDHQVKIRGFRVELGEVEFALGNHPDVKEVVVLAREDTPGDRRLIAYVVAEVNSAVSSGGLKDYLSDRLPRYMVPSMCMILEEMPLTPNGKVDRSRLPVPDRALIRSERTYVEPQDSLQKQLAEIWETVLKIRPIGVRDDFFELGGHSLLLVQIISRIEDKLGERIPMAELLQGVTIEHISKIIRHDMDTTSWSPLVPMQADGAEPPLFFVHAAGGNLFCYTQLAHHLGSVQAFYGLQSRESNKELEPHTAIEDMAQEYVGAIRAFRSEGPYLLGGWSMGGVIAFEMARQLQEMGEDVLMLALIDSEAPSERPPEYKWATLLGSFALDLGLAVDQLRESWDEIAALPPMKQLKLVAGEAKSAGLVPDDMSLLEFRKLFDRFKVNSQIMHSYSGGIFNGRIALFRTEERVGYLGKEMPDDYWGDSEKGVTPAVTGVVDPVGGWERWVTEGVDTVTVPGNHYSVLREPAVKLLAKSLLGTIQETKGA